MADLNGMIDALDTIAAERRAAMKSLRRRYFMLLWEGDPSKVARIMELADELGEPMHVVRAGFTAIQSMMNPPPALPPAPKKRPRERAGYNPKNRTPRK